MKFLGCKVELKKCALQRGRDKINDFKCCALYIKILNKALGVEKIFVYGGLQ